MRKRSVAMLLDKIFYFLLLLLPLFSLFIAFVFNYPKTNDVIAEFLLSLSFEVSVSGNTSFTYLVFDNTSGYLANMFSDLFLALFGKECYFLASYCQHIVIITLIHLLVDFVLMLPRVCQKLISKLGGDDIG